jgi:triacylglycerol lipase
VGRCATARLTGPTLVAVSEESESPLAEAVAHVLPDSVEHASLDPTPPPQSHEPAWWGRPFGELRWQAELARLLVDPVYAGRGVPRGDGGPVLLIPGFLAGQSSLSVMAGWLRRIGHDAHGSGIVANVDCSDRALDRLDRLLLRLRDSTGRPVALVGHSRGGHFAKALAARRPELVRSVVSMGAGLDTPFDISLPTKAAVAATRSVLVRLDPAAAERGCFTDTCTCPFTRDYTAPFPPSVPLTSVYSKGDGVVRWRSCVVTYADNVEVRGSHVGLAFNRHAYRAVAQALAPRTAS